MIADTSNADLFIAGATVAGSALALVAAFRSASDARLALAEAKTANKTAENAVAEARRLANAAERTLVSSVRPVIAGVPDIGSPIRYVTTRDTENQFNKDEGYVFHVRFPVRNIGPGPALIHDCHIGASIESRVGLGVQTLPSGAQARFQVTVPALSLDAIKYRTEIEEHGLVAFIQYSDAALGQRMLTKMSLRLQSDNDSFVMDSLQVYECDGEWAPKAKPFAEL
jgi:hypothetical protein